MDLAERFKVVPVFAAYDLTGGATMAGDSINMKNFHKATFLITLGTIGVADFKLYIYNGATDAAVTTALTFRYAYGGAATASATADVLAAESTSAALQVDQASKSNFLLVLEIDASDTSVANQYEWITLVAKDNVGGGGVTGTISAVAILEPRCTQNRSDTALT